MTTSMQKRAASGEVAGIPGSMDAAYDLCERLSRLGGAVPGNLRNKPGEIMAIVKAGAEVGIPPMKALSNVYLMDGRVIMGVHVMVGLAQAHPECEWFMVTETTAEKCVVKTQRRGYPEPSTLTYTIAEARTAGLAGRGTWKKHPAAMLRARASAQLARMAYADVLAGIYTHDEAVDINPQRARPHGHSSRPPQPTAEPEAIDVPYTEAPAEPVPSPREVMAQALRDSGHRGEDVSAFLAEKHGVTLGDLDGERAASFAAWISGDGKATVSAWLQHRRAEREGTLEMTLREVLDQLADDDELDAAAMLRAGQNIEARVNGGEAPEQVWTWWLDEGRAAFLETLS